MATLTCASMDQFEAVWQLYADVCAHQAQDRYGADWVLGVYPTSEDIRAHIEARELYVLAVDGRLGAAMALVPHEDPEYLHVTWPTPCAPEEVAVIHLLAVHPDLRGRHLGVELVREAIRLSRDMGKRAIHLDVVPGNLSASNIYQQAGFASAGTQQIYYEDTGLADFDLYEYVL